MSMWHLDHLRYQAEAFFDDPSAKEYPIGRKQWNVSDRLCDSLEGVLKTLTLTTCGEDEFTCDDGSCQPLENRLESSIL